MDERRRWPEAVYGVGEEPDVRYTLSNERTFLAWMRTSLGLLAAGVALDMFGADMTSITRRATAGFAVILAISCACTALLRWLAAERALRLGRPLPGASFAAGIALAFIVLGVVVLWLVLA